MLCPFFMKGSNRFPIALQSRRRIRPRRVKALLYINKDSGLWFCINRGGGFIISVDFAPRRVIIVWTDRKLGFHSARMGTCTERSPDLKMAEPEVMALLP
jgi:hypothetical protein